MFPLFLVSELPSRMTSGIRVQAEETKTTDELRLDKWALPRWGDKRALDIKPLEVEKWF